MSKHLIENIATLELEKDPIEYNEGEGCLTPSPFLTDSRVKAFILNLRFYHYFPYP